MRVFGNAVVLGLASLVTVGSLSAVRAAPVAGSTGAGVMQVQYRQDQYDQRRGYDDRYRDNRGRGGSYTASCGDIRQDGPMLSAVCDDGRGRRVGTSIDTSRCGRSDISNNRGILQCGGVRGDGRRLD